MAASEDPKTMTANERLRAVAVILAGGILRGRERRRDAAKSRATPENDHRAP